MGLLTEYIRYRIYKKLLTPKKQKDEKIKKNTQEHRTAR